MDSNTPFTIRVEDETKLESSYPLVSRAVKSLLDISQQDMSTYTFQHCVVYSDDPYTFVIVYTGLGDNGNNIIMGLSYSPSGTLIEVSMEIVLDWDL